MKTRYLTLLFLFVTIFLHLISFHFFPINYEFTFSEGSRFFDSFEKKYSNFYLDHQANTFLFSLLINVINRVTFDTFDNLLIARLISFSSYIFLTLGFINTCKFFNIHKSFTTLLIIFFLLNPVVWTLSLRSTPDLISASLGFFASSLILLKYSNVLVKRLSLLILGISISLKPFALIYLLYLFCFVKPEQIKIFKIKNLVDSIFLIIIPFLYFGAMKKYFGFFILSETHYFRHSLKINLDFITQNFIGYFCFLSIFIFPTSLSLRTKINYNTIFFFIVLILIGIYQFNFLKLGELNFGFFSSYINEYIILTISYSLLFILLLKLLEISKNAKIDKIDFKLIVTILIFIAILSTSKPVQRYLIFIIPILTILIVKNSRINNIKFLMLTGIFLYVPINLVSFLNMHSNSKLYHQIFHYLKSKNIEKVTDYRKLDHAFSFINVDNKLEKKYYISKNSNDFIMKFENKFFGREIVYYLNAKNN